MGNIGCVLRAPTGIGVMPNGQRAHPGSQAKLDEMLSHLDNFEFWFDIVTP